MVVTALFNPWDRAIYLSVIHSRPFLSWENFSNPYQGLGQTIFGRAFSTGLYFPLEDYCSRVVGRVYGGPLAGMVNGCLLNPLSLIKHQTWGADESRPFWSQWAQLRRSAGYGVVLRGMVPGVVRDGVFGFIFAMRKSVLTEDCSKVTQFWTSSVFAAAATAASSPFNLVRNLCYARACDEPLVSWSQRRKHWQMIVEDIFEGTRSQSTLRAKTSHMLNRLMIGWGTARVAVGMALSDILYSWCVACRGAGP